MESQNTQCQIDSKQSWLQHFPIMFLPALWALVDYPLLLTNLLKFLIYLYIGFFLRL